MHPWKLSQWNGIEPLSAKIELLEIFHYTVLCSATVRVLNAKHLEEQIDTIATQQITFDISDTIWAFCDVKMVIAHYNRAWCDDWPLMTFAVATTAPFFRISGSKSILYHSAPDPFTCSLGLGGITNFGLSRISSFYSQKKGRQKS